MVRSGDLDSVGGLELPRLAEVADDLTLPSTPDRSVAVEGRQNPFVREVLTPGLELLGSVIRRGKLTP